MTSNFLLLNSEKKKKTEILRGLVLLEVIHPGHFTSSGRELEKESRLCTLWQINMEITCFYPVVHYFYLHGQCHCGFWFFCCFGL